MCLAVTVTTYDVTLSYVYFPGKTKDAIFEKKPVDKIPLM